MYSLTPEEIDFIKVKFQESLAECVASRNLKILTLQSTKHSSEKLVDKVLFKLLLDRYNYLDRFTSEEDKHKSLELLNTSLNMDSSILEISIHQILSHFSEKQPCY